MIFDLPPHFLTFSNHSVLFFLISLHFYSTIYLSLTFANKSLYSLVSYLLANICVFSSGKVISITESFLVERCTIFGGSFKYYILYFIFLVTQYIVFSNINSFITILIISLYDSLYQLFFLDNLVRL